MVEDITERKHTEETLRRAERLASIGTLAAGIAHEINNPLGAITLSVDAVRLSADHDNREEIVAMAMKNIQVSALRCGRIVKSMLQFARDEATRKADADFAAIASRAHHMARSFARERDVRLELDVAENLPLVRINPTEMTQVCVNLLFNAVEASSPGGVVLMRLRATGEVLRMNVVDQGRGIPAEEIDHVFDPFYTTKGEQGGTGLGLSITYGIVQQHGGTIDVESKPGRGTTISISLPIAGDAAND
ncbi:MAG: two-component sensor histidine kinase, partial [Pirellulaceae bacterium]|nr:two-component sensor histidine kinase [Pirellulaceae bacterium]